MHPGPPRTPRPAPGDAALKLAPTQLETLRRHSSESLRRAAEALRAHDGAAVDSGARRGSPGLAVVDVRSLALGEFPGAAPLPEGDDHAVAVATVEGGVVGTALLALEPHDALRWVRVAAPDAEPLESFVWLGGCVLREWLAGLGRAFGVAPRLGRVALREDPVVAVALATHAPPDTAIVCARISVGWGEDDVGEGRTLAACLYLLVEPKLLVSLLSGLEVS